MLSTQELICKPPVEACGLWVRHPINNWVKATELLNKHAKSEWLMAAIEKDVMAQAAKKQGDVMERVMRVSEEDKRTNMELLVRSVYYLVKHHGPHTTTFSGLVTLQIENGDEQLRLHNSECAGNASYLSKFSIAEFIGSISHHIEQDLLSHLGKSRYISTMADECTDVASKEEMSICARWTEGGRAVEHFLGNLRAGKVDAKSSCLIFFGTKAFISKVITSWVRI